MPTHSGHAETETATDQSALAEVAEAFGLGAAESVAVITEGLLNRNWRVAAGGAQYAVKQLVALTADQARRQHAATAALAGRGLPVPAPRRTPSGDTVWRDFCVFPWIRGSHVGRGHWSPRQATHVGELIAQLHLGLAEVMPPITSHAAPVAVTSPGTAREAIDRLLRLIAARPAPDAFDVLASQRLRDRLDLLTRVAHLRPDETAAVEPHGWIHGDFHHFNLLWSEGEVVAVIDWDRLRVAPLALEVVRAATLIFGTDDERGLDLDLVAAFARAYLRVRPLTADQLADAAHRLWWQRVCETWQLERHYEQHDTSCDHLFFSASDLLHWWTAHRTEVTAALTA